MTLIQDDETLMHLEKLTKIISDRLEDRGGPRTKNAFRVLINGLAKAFELGRGRSAAVTKSADGYSGDFMRAARPSDSSAARILLAGRGIREIEAC